MDNATFTDVARRPLSLLSLRMKPGSYDEECNVFRRHYLKKTTSLSVARNIFLETLLSLSRNYDPFDNGKSSSKTRHHHNPEVMMVTDIASQRITTLPIVLHKLDQSKIQRCGTEDIHTIPVCSFGPIKAVPFSCVHHAFAFHCRRTPDAVAAITHGGEGERITYRRLDVLSTRMAEVLRGHGAKAGGRVIILIQRSIPMLVAILATLKTGAAYVPLDGGIATDATVLHIANDSAAQVVAVGREWSHRVDTLNSELVRDCKALVSKVVLEDVIEHIELDETNKLQTFGEDHFSKAGKGNDGCYVIYTSGTTGKPKGVDVTHSNVTNLLCLSPGNIGMRAGMRVAQLLNIAFDMCAWEVLGALSNGCTLILRGKTSKEWKTALRNVDIVIATPSILGMHEPTDYPNIKFVATAGEVCPQALADKWSKYTQFHNSCGPTEITIVNTIETHFEGAPLSIGRPTPNNSVYILDTETMFPVPVGIPGIMWAGGKGVTRGYLGLDALTKEKFKPDPWIAGGVMFNTGDIGRWRDDGMIEHLGRADDQVKVKGFRVELDGVAVAMETCRQVKAAVALLIGTELWGFLTPSTVKTESVEIAAARIQPYYAVPTRFLVLEKFPQTSNGKIDKRALRAMVERQSAPRSTDVNTSHTIPQASDIMKRLQCQNLVFTPYWASHCASLAISKEVTLETCRYTDDGPTWTSLVEKPTPPPATSTIHLTFQPFISKDFTSHDVFSGSDNSSSTSSSSISGDTKINNIAAVNTPDLAEKGDHDIDADWQGYQNEELPPQTHSDAVSRLRHAILTLYRRLFGVVLVVNLAIFVATLVKGHTNALQLGQIVVANFFVAVLMRQDYVVNIFFTIFCAVPTSWPLFIRRVCARVYHIGGLHSGAAISAIVWLILFSVQATIEMVQHKVSIATLVVTYVILLLLLMIVFFAYPKFRSVSHNRFEQSHRFMGWSATALVWAQVILLVNDYKPPRQNLGDALKLSVPFWLVVIMTCSIILPWARLRRVPVRAEVLSSHAVRLYFDYVTPIPGSYTRISESPLLEWHSFATVAEPGKTGYSLVVSKAGDWTTKQIENPPTHLWVRGIPTFGVLRIVPLFRRLVFVATGSGIGPCAPCLLEQRVPIRLLWTSPDVRKTFGDKLVDSLLEASPGAIVYDTRKHGKPDMVKLTMKLVRDFNAEAVCVISNQKLTQQVVYGMMSRGIPAFGAIWDS